VGVAHRDQPVGEGRGFSLPYSLECVEGFYSEIEMQDRA
jgi:hypothetical protein